jgi:hypothetical protein
VIIAGCSSEEGISYLEVIGDVVFAVARATKEKVLVLSSTALSLVRRGRLRVIDVGIRVFLRSRRVLGGARHGR